MTYTAAVDFDLAPFLAKLGLTIRQVRILRAHAHHLSDIRSSAAQDCDKFLNTYNPADITDELLGRIRSAYYETIR